jgi:hypothetical protein
VRQICIFDTIGLCAKRKLEALPLPHGVDTCVVLEPHKALNWVVRFPDDAAWYDIDKPIYGKPLARSHSTQLLIAQNTVSTGKPKAIDPAYSA